MAGVGKRHETLAGVQALRAIAAILVVIEHANSMMRYPRYFGASPYLFGEIGRFGVAMFFVISGFIVCVVSLDRDWQPKQGIAVFAQKRFFRIVPFMWLCVIGYNILTYLATGVVEWLPALRALFVVFPGELKPNVLWSIRHEIVFYTLFALCVWYGRSRLYLLLPWFLLPLIVPLLMPVADPTLNGTDTFPRILVWIYGQGSNTGANLQFGAGMALALLWLKGSRVVQPSLPAALPALLATALLATAAVEALALPNGIAKSVTWTVLAMVVVLVAIAGRYNPSSLPTRVAVSLGNASFALYLTHIPVLLTTLELCRRLRMRPDGTLFIAAVVIAAILVSLVLHRWVERPLIQTLTPLRVLPGRAMAA